MHNLLIYYIYSARSVVSFLQMPFMAIANRNANVAGLQRIFQG